jgi:AAA domain-containing protein
VKAAQGWRLARWAGAVQWRWRQVRRLVRWHSVLFPLLAAVTSALVALLLSAGGGNRWCNTSSFSCSVDTNLLGVVLVGGATSYWFYGFRRALLLARLRRAVLARARRTGPDDGSDAATTHDSHAAILAAVLARYRDWRSDPPVTVVAGPPGSGKTRFLNEVVSRLAGSRSWYVPVPLADIPGGGEQDILDTAQRQIAVILHDASINPGLIESLSRSLTQARRLMIVIDNIDRIGPALSAYERASVVQRLMSSAQRLELPLLATAQTGSVESIAGSVIELPPPEPGFIRQRIDGAQAIPAGLKHAMLPALAGPLATPAMVDRVIRLMRREGDRLTTALQASGEPVADLVVWRHLLAACQVPGSVLTPEGLELAAYVLLITGEREITVGGTQWQDAQRLAHETGIVLPSHSAGLDQIAAYVEGGFLAADSSPVLLRFASPDVQAVLAAQFLVRDPARVSGLVPQLAASAPAREAVAGAIRFENANGLTAAHSCLLAALNGAAPLTAAAHAAGLSLAIQHAPPGLAGAGMDELAERLALVLADRVTAGSGPALGVAGLRDALRALEAANGPNAEQHLLTALHSSSFQVRLGAALGLIRRGRWELIERRVEEWIRQAEAPEAGRVQHQLGLALWFCPHLAETEQSARGDELYLRGLRLAAHDDSNPLMFEVSLARGFKLAAWARPELAADERALHLLTARPRFWYSRICLVHAAGIRLATPAGRQASAGAGLAGRAHEVITLAAMTDPHPLVREAARITIDGLAAGAEPARFCWLSESEMGGSNSRLADEAMRLLGDVSLLMNLIYCAEPWSDTEWRLLGTTSDLPVCIRRPAQREQHMAGGCPHDCAFGLCPYPGPSRRPRGRGELSAAFCQAQHDVAERLGPASWHERRAGRPRVDFWLYAEQYLANRDGWEINL